MSDGVAPTFSKFSALRGFAPLSGTPLPTPQASRWGRIAQEKGLAGPGNLARTPLSRLQAIVQ